MKTHVKDAADHSKPQSTVALLAKPARLFATDEPTTTVDNTVQAMMGCSPQLQKQQALQNMVNTSSRSQTMRVLQAKMTAKGTATNECGTAATLTTSPADASVPPVQRVSTLFTDDLKNATPTYLRELADQYAPGLWDITNAGAFAVTHKGRKNAMGMSDATYSAAILKTTARTGWFGLDTKHFNNHIELSSPRLAATMHGRDCSNAAEYLMHYQQGQDLAAVDATTGAAIHPTRSQVESSSNASSDYVAATARPAILPAALPAGVKDANAQAGIGEAYCIVSEPNSGKYNFHYGCVAAQKGGEILTVEGFATSSVLTTPDWSFNVYDSTSTFHGVWQAGMTKATPPFAPGYPFTFVTKLL